MLVLEVHELGGHVHHLNTFHTVIGQMSQFYDGKCVLVARSKNILHMTHIEDGTHSTANIEKVHATFVILYLVKHCH